MRPKAIIVVVSNPLDVMCYVAMKASGFPRERVLGMAGVLDTARYRTFLAEAMDVSVRGHPGDGARRPRRHHGAAGLLHDRLGHPGEPAASRPTSSTSIVDRTRNGGAEIVAFLKTGSAYYAPSAAAVQMVEAIALDKRRILPCSAWLQGEFGLRDVFCGVPCKLGRNGLERIVEITLTDAERAELRKSAEAVRSTQAVVDAA